MLKNFQRYFRFYLATFLFGLLLVGIRWQAAPLGEKLVPQETPDSEQQVVAPSHRVTGDMAMR
ncbi:hypothetical protein Q5H92_12445 [Hymenobacter sp. M29]|uniref:Uncharacterized protein n=1 Tax=Hymenobacter mellowenesis TaxID=3063995 RepID=A0ABT9ACB0_9BACT|nr:hypothetical protein [Hymenobacter sp. M29]MDO7847173.1 hypothetical protein [Hymenobacter sp. M29]